MDKKTDKQTNKQTKKIIVKMLLAFHILYFSDLEAFS